MAAVPIKTPRQPTIYPIEADTLYFNLGCYCQVRRPAGKPPDHYTRVMDDKCFDLGGVKMLYSSTFLDKEEFDRRFNGRAYNGIKAKYDPDGAAPTFKLGFGFHPLVGYLDRGDGTGEALAGMLRPGNAGANTAADHIDVFETAIDQLAGVAANRVLVRADSAGATKAFLAGRR